jgi:ubiquinone/menaquinone biosynthesis C-methylase UbiE
LYAVHSQSKPQKREGFSQRERFVVNTGSDIYDDFYCQIYDTIHKKSFDFEMIKATNPSKNSVFLDVGSGTGDTVYALTRMGYQAYGIEKSPAMVRISQKKYPTIRIIQGDVMDPMKFDNDTFTHIYIRSTIDFIPDKYTFFRYCYSWLKPGGHLIIHVEEYPKAMEFKGVKYDTYKKENEWSERFVDKKTGNVRENEYCLYREPISEIDRKAMDSGFKKEAEGVYIK